MNCAEFEALLAEALDGALAGAERERFEAHRAGCADCGPLYADAAAGMNWMKSLEEVEPPRHLVHNILAATSGQEKEREAAREPGRNRLREWLGPYVFPAYTALRQPRFVMSAAMAFFSISLLMQVTGVKLADLRHVDLRPGALQSSAVRTYSETSSRVVKYYENIRLVYEIQTRMQELKDAATPPPQSQPSGPKPDNNRQNNDTSGQPDQEKEQRYSQENGSLVLASANGPQPISGGVLSRSRRQA
jgi:hypothetical protein